MQRAATLDVALTQLLKTILDRKILSKTQIIALSHKGLANDGTNSCYINVFLKFMFETIRCIPTLKQLWETYVESVVTYGILDNPMQSDTFAWFIYPVCLAYHSMYTQLLRAEDIKQIKAHIDHELNNSRDDGLGDALIFGHFFARKFQQAHNSPSPGDDRLEGLAREWRELFQNDLFTIIGCEVGSRFFARQYTNPVTDNIAGFTAQHCILFTTSHYKFYKRFANGWIEFDDSTVTYRSSRYIQDLYPFVLVFYK